MRMEANESWGMTNIVPSGKVGRMCGSFVFFLSCIRICLCARLFICTLWSPAGKGLPSRLSFVVSNCKFVTFRLVSWVRCGT